MLNLNKSIIHARITDITNYAVELVGISLIQAFMVMILWNYIFPDIISIIKPINYAQSIILILLLRILMADYSKDNVKRIIAANYITLNQTNQFLAVILAILNEVFPPKLDGSAKQEDIKNNTENKHLS